MPANAPRKRSLSQDTVLQTALELVRRVGVEGFTMRELAAQLGVSQMAAYHYFGNKDRLLAMVGDSILSEVRLPAERSGSWEERLIGVARDLLDVFEAWPGTIEVTIRYHPPHIAKLAEGLVDLLREAGFADQEAVLAASMLTMWMRGLAVTRTLLAQYHASPDERERNPLIPIDADDRPSVASFTDYALAMMLHALRARLAGELALDWLPAVTPQPRAN
jgi:AcrR family transcriptional regulator